MSVDSFAQPIVDKNNDWSTDQIKIIVDPGIVQAQNRKFEYRGMWAQLMNCADFNEEVGDQDMDGSTDEDEIEDQDDCPNPSNTDIYPLRFSTLKGTIMNNLTEKWPNVPVAQIREASKHVFELFDYDAWTSEHVSTDSYISSPDCKVIALIGVVRTFKAINDTYTSRQFHKLRMANVPSRKPTEAALQTIQLMSDDGEDGITLISQDSSTIDAKNIVSGIPCACVGFVVEGNRFVISDIIYATPCPCAWPKTVNSIEMVFVSGMLFGDGVQEHSMETEMLSDYLLGLCKSTDEQEQGTKPKTRVFFVGNSFSRGEDHFDEPSGNEIQRLQNARLELDSFFSTLAASDKTEVIIIPGETDPTEKVLPQKPFDSTFFPRLHEQKFYKHFHNPCSVQVIEDDYNKLNVILSSGSNIEMVKRYLPKESTLSIASKMLQWGHLNPAARDYFPLQDNDSTKEDLFAIKHSLPHLYVIGNQQQFAVRQFQTTKVICLPSFAETHQVVSLMKNENSSYDILPIRFGVC